MMLDLFKLEGKIALVTGATHGLGMAMATALAESGAQLVDFLGMGILLKTKEKIRLGDAPILSESIIRRDRWDQPLDK